LGISGINIVNSGCFCLLLTHHRDGYLWHPSLINTPPHNLSCCKIA
jgi:hypothetical protein